MIFAMPSISGMKMSAMSAANDKKARRAPGFCLCSEASG
jgi:hypothetical protein